MEGWRAQVRRDPPAHAFIAVALVVDHRLWVGFLAPVLSLPLVLLCDLLQVSPRGGAHWRNVGGIFLPFRHMRMFPTFPIVVVALLGTSGMFLCYEIN